ncbi:hypothetical protein F8388_011571 [Cannabis sativa]|uniref:CCHC-type domain-containing protein n=1 Tax=Cannabis sativa TaxID=3483 RepID=A0A7J6FYE5_CANSA|nr:hypothetical protein G4B88_015132 [Cannabis sativa]KAF4387423.1 hypothetical protein F8388_011571 [Cannabis sativa]
MIDLVKNVWKRPARVVPVLATTINNNCFELIFEKVEDRNWALLRSPWNFRGKLLLLKSWEPSVLNGSPFTHTRLWVQIHKLPVEFFSVSNGNKLGSRVGNVVVVDLDEENPASWAKWLRVLVEIDIGKPLFSGCFINVGDEANVWVQFKYEKVGAFCYFCGRLGHQRSECSLSAPNTVSDVHGRSFPLFGPWLNTDSQYLDCFAGKSKIFSAPKRASSSSARGLQMRQCATPLLADPAVGKEVVAGASSSAVALRKSKMTSRGPRSVHHHGADAVWVPKVVDGVQAKAGSGERPSFVAVSGNEASKIGEAPEEPLVKDGMCTNGVTLEGGPSNDKRELGLGVVGPGRDLDLYEIKKIGGDIGVKPSSETNERTTPFKKRKFEGSASLCTRPNKIVRRHPDVVRDFPWDICERDRGSKADFDDISEEPTEGSSSPSCNNGDMNSWTFSIAFFLALIVIA